MIAPRYQTVLFAVLLAASAIMATVLWHLREHAHQRLLQGVDSAPTQAPEIAAAEQATLLVASDNDNTLLSQVQTLPLPQDHGSRARLILGKLLDLYAAPNAAHPVPGGAASVTQVFLLPAPDFPGDAKSPGSKSGESELAVVNLAASFVASHPSGIEIETLTIQSICATLHANLPRVTQVRFLVDGQVHPTLAGHADLTRTYLAAEAVPTEGAHP